MCKQLVDIKWIFPTTHFYYRGQHLWGTYCMLGTIIGMLTEFICTVIYEVGIIFHFKDEETIQTI